MIATVDKNEVERFGAIAGEWWDPKGKFAALHRINPVRLLYIREQIFRHTGIDPTVAKPFSELQVLDIGCGGGLICEPLRRLGASVTGIDPSPESIIAARAHAESLGLKIEYLEATAEALIAEGRQFDCVLALEVIEHVPNAVDFLKNCAELMKPEALLVLSTLNRTAKSFVLGIVAAEYVLGWLPKGTHQWSRFLTPDELRERLGAARLEPQTMQGLSFDPIEAQWKLSEDCSVNYFATAKQPVHRS
jgi:2-polyprenyl-6-hydroxyphenyl methylase/3-demethylubiquinone-9 3-methyltransferase